MSTWLAELVLGVLIVGGVTGVITVFALVLARREDREGRETRREVVSPLAQAVRRAS